jgi:hypothetical protein
VLEAIEAEAESRAVGRIQGEATFEFQSWNGEVRIWVSLTAGEDEDKWAPLCFKSTDILANVAARLTRDDDKDWAKSRRADLVVAVRQLADQIEALPIEPCQ